MTQKKHIGAILIGLALYFFGLLLESVFICYFPQYLEYENNDLRIKEKIIEYKTTGRVSNWSSDGVAVIIYDDQQSFYRFFGQGSSMFTMQFYYQSHDKAERILNGEDTYDFYVLVNDYSSLGYCSRIYIGRRIELDGRSYAFFWVKELSYLPEMLLGFMIAYTLLFAASFALVLVNLYRKDQYALLQKKYIDNITHELKTPVASVKAITEALSDGLAEDEARRNVYYGMILSETNRQQKMIQEALLLSKLQSRLDKVTLSGVSAGALFTRIEEKYEILYDLAGLEFQILDSARNLPELYANEDSLFKVVSTLLDNTIKYVPEGGKVVISGRVAAKRAIICIEDSGDGIPKEDLPYIFERFYRANRDDKKYGSGLGLAIAKELVNMLHGDIWAESERGLGTRMYLKLRIQRSASNKQC